MQADAGRNAHPFSQAPSFEGFDGGAGSRYQARREMRSFWYPTWLAQPAALVPGSRLIDAPARDSRLPTCSPLAADYDLAVLHTSTPSFASDVRVAGGAQSGEPGPQDGLVGAQSRGLAGASSAASRAIDFVAGKEFDFTIREVAEGRDCASIDGLVLS